MKKWKISWGVIFGSGIIMGVMWVCLFYLAARGV